MEYTIHAMPGKAVVALDPPEETIGRIVKPDTAIGDNNIGTVIAVTVDDVKYDLHVGDRVVLSRYSGAPTELNGRELHFIKISDVLARLTPASAEVLSATHA